MPVTVFTCPAFTECGTLPSQNEGKVAVNGRPSVGRITATLRSSSKALLGNQFRAEVIAFVGAAEPPFWARRISQQLGVPETKVASELARLATLGLLVPLSAEWDRRKLYERTASAVWSTGLELVEEAAEAEAERIGSPVDDVLEVYWRAVMPDQAQPARVLRR
jgi:hypothetical protein